ncbi:hypothetical protein ACMD2_25566 [Ananas comosus]|uniref:Transmembrane protein 45B n=1 Tax=Ananas comosus TaxID=4615 RepID=A0A199W1W2_ANACO|nr:hypothetical protein ACMD2_25566 [Ananas comosus]
MGTLIGHVAPGVGFLLVGLWHLFNHIKLFSLRPKTYVAPPWFPAPRLGHLELVLIIAGSLTSIASELFLGPAAHQPFDPADGTIPSYHLQNFEHAAISLAFLIYAAFAIHIDRTCTTAAAAMTQLIARRSRSSCSSSTCTPRTTPASREGQYHWLLQLVVAASLATALLGVAAPRSFAMCFVRLVSMTFQGVWFMVMGFMLWTPSLVSKGCSMNYEVGHVVHGSVQQRGS